MNKLRNMTLFMTIVESGSLTKAAEKLELSKSVLSQHLKQLENELSTTLLKRTTRKQSLTPAGERFYIHCKEMSAIAEQAWQEVLEQQQEPTGRLSITAPHAIMDSIVVPSLTNTFSLQSQLSLNLVCHDQQLDLMTHNLDLAIRVGDSQDSSYKQQRVGSFKDVLCCSKSYQMAGTKPVYIANHWQPKHIEHQLTNEKAQDKYLNYEATHRVNTLSQVIRLIESGVGIGIVPDFIFQRHSELIEVMPDFELAPTQVYALHPYHHSVPLSVSMAIQGIKQTFQKITEQ